MCIHNMCFHGEIRKRLKKCVLFRIEGGNEKIKMQVWARTIDQISEIA